MQKLVVHKVGVLSLAKLVGVWMAIIGLAVGIIGSIATTVGVISENNYSVLMDLLVSVGIILGWLILYPLVMFLVGWIHGAILAVIFNIVVAGSGGLNVDVEESNIKPDTVNSKR